MVAGKKSRGGTERLLRYITEVGAERLQRPEDPNVYHKVVSPLRKERKV